MQFRLFLRVTVVVPFLCYKLTVSTLAHIHCQCHRLCCFHEGCCLHIVKRHLAAKVHTISNDSKLSTENRAVALP